jgi:hypothetical protein
VQPRKREPKPTGKGAPIQVKDDVPTRLEAIRRLVEMGLKGKGKQP